MDVLSDAITSMRSSRPHAARHELHSPWRMPFPAAGDPGFHVVLQGTCGLTSSSGTIRMGPGDVVFLRDGREHTLTDGTAQGPVAAAPYAAADGGADAGGADAGGSGAAGTADTPAAVLLCGSYRLSGTRLHPLLLDLPGVIHLPSRIGSHLGLRAAVDMLGAELDTPRPGSDGIVAGLLDILLLHFLRAWYDELAARQVTTGWAAALNDPAVTAALRGIHHDPGRRWTVEELGGEAGLSRAAFSRRFTSMVGEPPLTYLTRWRMTTAARLLRDGDAPLSEVADRSGYTSEFAFAKAFKREHGVAPGRYRRRAVARGVGQDVAEPVS